jgi:hypothetical protein
MTTADNRDRIRQFAGDNLDFIATYFEHDHAERVAIWDDEWEQYHIEDPPPKEGEGIELSASVIAVYRYAAEVWQAAQAVLNKAVDEVVDSVLEGQPEDRRDPSWVFEWFRGDITKAQLDARLEPCPHPEDLIVINHGVMRRCNRCAQYLPKAQA